MERSIHCVRFWLGWMTTCDTNLCEEAKIGEDVM